MDIAAGVGDPGELRHGVGEGAQGVVTLAQGRLGRLLHGYVAKMDGNAAFGRRRDGKMHPVLENGRNQLEIDPAPVAHHAPIMLMGQRVAHHRENVEEGPADHLLAGLAEHGFRAPVEIDDAPVRIERVKTVGDAVENLVRLALGRRQLVARIGLLGDVEQGDEGVRRPATRRVFDAHAAVDPAHDPVLAGDPELEAAALAGLEQVGDQRPEFAKILRIDARGDIFQRILEGPALKRRARPVAHHLLVIFRRLDTPRCQVDLDIGEARGVGGVAQLLLAQPQRRLAVAQALFGALALGDVHGDAGHAQGDVGGVTDDSTRRGDPARFPGGERHAIFRTVERGAGRENVPQRLRGLRAVLDQHAVQPDSEARRLRGIEPMQAEEVGRPDRLVRRDIPLERRRPRALQREAQPLLAFHKGLFGALAVGDVDVGSDHPFGFAARIGPQGFRRLDDADFAVVGAADAEFAPADAGGLGMAAQRRVLVGFLLGQQRVQPDIIMGPPAGRRRNAVDAEHFRVPDQFVGAHVPFPHAKTGGLGGELEALLALPQGVFRAPLRVDVPDDTDRARGGAAVVAQRLCGDMGPDRGTFGRLIERFELDGLLAAQDPFDGEIRTGDPPPLPVEGGPSLGCIRVPARRDVADETGHGRILEDDTALRVDDGDGDGHLLEGPRQRPLAFARLRLGQLAGGDVGANGDVALGTALSSRKGTTVVSTQ